LHALSANRRQLQDERDKKIGSMRADIQALADRIAVEAQALREHQSKRSEIQGEVQVLNAKLESNKSVMLELKLTRERISQLLTDLHNQRRSGEQLVDALKAEEVQLRQDLAGVKERLNKELEDINFRLDVQEKAISGLTGFQKKVSADLEYIRSKLLSTEHVLLELEETIKRIGMMLDAAVQRHDLQLQGIEKIRSEIERSDSLRKAAASKEQDALERLHSQIQAEQKLKAGVTEYQQRLIEDKFLAEKRSHVEMAKVRAAQEYLQRVEKEVQDYRAGCDAAASAVNELEQQRAKVKAELSELDVKFLGEIDDVQERLEVDLRASVGLEGYRRNIGDEIELIRQKLGVRRSAFNT
jgi:chromosome segregation ATPase